MTVLSLKVTTNGSKLVTYCGWRIKYILQTIWNLEIYKCNRFAENNCTTQLQSEMQYISESNSERILKIGQYCQSHEQKSSVMLFLTHTVDCS